MRHGSSVVNRFCVAKRQRHSVKPKSVIMMVPCIILALMVRLGDQASYCLGFFKDHRLEIEGLFRVVEEQVLRYHRPHLVPW